MESALWLPEDILQNIRWPWCVQLARFSCIWPISCRRGRTCAGRGIRPMTWMRSTTHGSRSGKYLEEAIDGSDGGSSFLPMTIVILAAQVKKRDGGAK